MAETTREYVARVLGYLEQREPIEVLTSTPTSLATLIGGKSPAVLSTPPAAGKWSVQEILAHLADTEIVMGYRVRRVLEKDGAALDGFDQNRWAAVGRYAEHPPEESLDRLRAQRRTNVALLRSLTPDQLARTGIHAERGAETVTRLTQLWAGHDLNHLLQVERIVRA